MKHYRKTIIKQYKKEGKSGNRRVPAIGRDPRERAIRIYPWASFSI